MGESAIAGPRRYSAAVSTPLHVLRLRLQPGFDRYEQRPPAVSSAGFRRNDIMAITLPQFRPWCYREVGDRIIANQDN